MRPVLYVLASSCALAVTACFGAVAVVPATEAPPPPPGAGWHCFESAQQARYGSRTVSSTVCKRAPEACDQVAVTAHRQNPLAVVSACHPAPKVFCTASFTGPSDASWECFGDVAQCSTHVGGMGGVPGMKQSQCAEYE